jgi:quercetin dioxygenase-like cupin family protein
MERASSYSVVTRTSEGWAGVEAEGYVPGGEARVVRHTLIGRRKESHDEPGPALELRYFEVPSGAVTRLEKHEHEHYVIVGHGHGHAIVGTEVHEIGPRDVVYVGPLVPHQFVNRSEASFGFFCVVPAVRDFAQRLDAAELAKLISSPAGAFADPGSAPTSRARHKPVL